MVLIVIPAYNEAKNIGRVIRGLFEKGHKNILVVDDGSIDDTFKIAKENSVNVVRHCLNRGQGASLETGNQWARGNEYEMVVHFDADGQFEAEDIEKGIEKMLNENLDIVLGSRFLDKRTKMPKSKKYLIIPIGRLVNKIFSGIWLSDAHNGFRIMGKNALQNLKIEHDGMSHNTEIVAKIKKFNLKYAEFPVKVNYQEYGQGLKGGIKIVKDLFFSFFIN